CQGYQFVGIGFGLFPGCGLFCHNFGIFGVNGFLSIYPGRERSVTKIDYFKSGTVRTLRFNIPFAI
ncbi:MAG TPA: hypothetical protein PLU64_17505, partial [Saprospiraceae bacterium]|nr:hypothetical protein [Saprospiraceae bacterium]